MILKIAVLALLITLAVTIIGTVLLLRQAGKPEEERTSPIFAPEHIENPKTQEDWDAWEKDPWKEQWDDWDEWKLQKPDGPENREKAANPVNGEKRKPTEDTDGLKDQGNTDKAEDPDGSETREKPEKSDNMTEYRK